MIPGLVNTHHHFYQTLTRTLAQDAELFDWLTELYPIWAKLTPIHVRVSTITALAETGALWLHHRLRSPLPVAQRRLCGQSG